MTLAAVEDALGWDARDAEVILGTSGGAELAAALGAGISTQTLIAAMTGSAAPPVLSTHFAHRHRRFPPRPALALPALGLARAGLARRSPYPVIAALLPRGRGDASWLYRYGEALADSTGWVSHPQTWLVAADAATGQRAVFGAPGFPTAHLGEALAASWAIPGWFPPVAIGARRYLDGGAVSSVSADLLASIGLDEVIVIAPMTSKGGAPGRGPARAERVLRRQMTRGLNQEIGVLETSGARVVRVEPGREDLAVMGANFMDADRRHAVIRTATRTAAVQVAAALPVVTSASSTVGVRR